MTTKRTHRERSQEMMALLINRARLLFGTRGYDAVSLDEIVADAGVTKGALYHHFPKGKVQLFEAVVLAEQNALVAAVTARHDAERNDTIDEELSAYFDAATAAPTYQITMIDAPAILGRARWRDIEYAHGARLIEAGLENQSANTAPNAINTPMLVAALFGAFIETTVMVAEAKDKSVAKRDAIAVLKLLAGT